MNYKRLGSIIVMLMLLVFPASASMVCFLIVETGVDDEAASTQYSSLWEGGLMSAFFDAGHIVTNHPIERMEKKPAQDLSDGIANNFYDALDGGADYFIVCYLECRNQGGLTVPLDIIIKLYGTNTQELIFEQNFPAGKVNLGEEYLFAQSAGRLLISSIKDR